MGAGEEQRFFDEARQLAASGEGRQLREAAGLSIGEMSCATGADGLTLMRWETGERPTGTAAVDWVYVIRMLRHRGTYRRVPW